MRRRCQNSDSLRSLRHRTTSDWSPVESTHTLTARLGLGLEFEFGSDDSRFAWRREICKQVAPSSLERHLDDELAATSGCAKRRRNWSSNRVALAPRFEPPTRLPVSSNTTRRARQMAPRASVATLGTSIGAIDDNARPSADSGRSSRFACFVLAGCSAQQSNGSQAASRLGIQFWELL